MLRGSGYVPFQKRAAEQFPLAQRSRPLRNDDPRLIAVMIGFFAIMLFIGMGLMWAFTPTRHSGAVIGHDHAATSVPSDHTIRQP
jgi:hypothetical protein